MPFMQSKPSASRTTLLFCGCNFVLSSTFLVFQLSVFVEFLRLSQVLWETHKMCPRTQGTYSVFEKAKPKHRQSHLMISAPA